MEGFCHNFAIICFYLTLLFLPGVSFIKIIQEIPVLIGPRVFDEFTINPDYHISITMAQDPRNPEWIFAATQCIGGETMSGLFHLSVVKTGLFQGRLPLTFRTDPSLLLFNPTFRTCSLRFFRTGNSSITLACVLKEFAIFMFLS